MATKLQKINTTQMALHTIDSVIKELRLMRQEFVATLPKQKKKSPTKQIFRHPTRPELFTEIDYE